MKTVIKSMRHPRRHFRTRETLFSPVDEAAFTEALRQEYPTVLFIQDTKWRGDAAPFPQSLHECEDHKEIYLSVSHDADWQPEIVSKPHTDVHYLAAFPDLLLQCVRSRWNWGPRHYQRQWSFEWPTLTVGRFAGSFSREEPADELQRAFIRKTWRIIRRIATNRIKAGHPMGNKLMFGDRILMEDAKGGLYWAGHHALEWCAAGPRRMLNGCFRPCDDWAPPQDEWYRGLRALVLEKYGPGLGETPAEP